MQFQEFASGGLRPFFEAFAAKSTASDIEGLTRLYASSILVAGPDGTHIVTSADLLRVIPKRKQLFESIGYRSTTLVGLHEIELDQRYTLARTEWQWQFGPPGAAARDELTLPSTFIVERSSDGPRIVVYVMHQDVVGVLRDRGWLPRAV
jgi:hypothetical protein